MMDILVRTILTGGFLASMAILIIAWKLHTEWGKTLSGVAVFFIFMYFLGLWGAPILVRGFWSMLTRVEIANQEGYAEYQSAKPQPLISQETVDGVAKFFGGSNAVAPSVAFSGSGSDSGAAVNGSGTSGSNADTGSTGQTQSLLPNTNQPTVTKTLKQNAIAQWFVEKAGCKQVGEALQCMPSRKYAGGIPTGVSFTATCTLKCRPLIINWDTDARFEIVLTTADNSLTPVKITSNGYFGGGPSIGGNNGTVTGVGGEDWGFCKSCWDSVIVSAPPVATQAPAINSPATPDVTVTPDATAIPTVVKITDSSGGGAWWYKAVNGSCVGVSHSKSGTIPFDTPITVVKTFPGAGWVSYLGSADMLLVETDKCIFAGTIK